MALVLTTGAVRLPLLVTLTSRTTVKEAALPLCIARTARSSWRRPLSGTTWQLVTSSAQRFVVSACAIRDASTPDGKSMAMVDVFMMVTSTAPVCPPRTACATVLARMAVSSVAAAVGWIWMLDVVAKETGACGGGTEGKGDGGGICGGVGGGVPGGDGGG